MFARQEKICPLFAKKHVSRLLAVILFDRHRVKIYSFVNSLFIYLLSVSCLSFVSCVLDALYFQHDSPPECVFSRPHHRSFHVHKRKNGTTMLELSPRREKSLLDFCKPLTTWVRCWLVVQLSSKVTWGYILFSFGVISWPSVFIKQEDWRLELQIFLTARHFEQVACIIRKNIWYCFVAPLASCRINSHYTLWCVCVKTFLVTFADWLPENGQATQWNIRRKRLVNYSQLHWDILSLVLIDFQGVCVKFQAVLSQRRFWVLYRWSISSILPWKAWLHFWIELCSALFVNHIFSVLWFQRFWRVRRWKSPTGHSLSLGIKSHTSLISIQLCCITVTRKLEQHKRKWS